MHYIPFSDLTPPQFGVCPKQWPRFPMSYVVVFFVSVPMCEMRGDCSFCWYWWNCWLSLFKTYLLNVYNSQCFKTNTICIVFIIKWRIRVMVFNATFNNIAAISWRSVLLVEETGVPWENHRPDASHFIT